MGCEYGGYCNQTVLPFVVRRVLRWPPAFLWIAPSKWLAMHALRRREMLYAD